MICVHLLTPCHPRSPHSSAQCATRTAVSGSSSVLSANALTASSVLFAVSGSLLQPISVAVRLSLLSCSPSHMPLAVSPFPDLSDNPNIYVTSPGLQSSVNPASSAPTPGRFAPPPLSMNNVHMGNPTSLHSMHSPNSNSPTQPDFSAPQQQGQAQQASSTTPAPALSRQQSFQHVSYLRGDASPLPTSPGSSTMEIYEESDAPSQTRGSTKRQRISADDDLHPHPHAHSHATHTHMHGSAPPSAHTDIPPPPSSLSSPGQSLPRRPSRARSDSAPLGYGFGSMGMGWAGAGRPRSGSARGVGLGVPNMSMTNGNIGPRGVGVGMATGAGAQTGLGLGALGVQSTVGASTVGR